MVIAGAMLGAALFAGSHLQGQPAAADAGSDSDLFSLTNQDRASNGVAALEENGTLAAIGEAAPYSGCAGAGTIDGRAQDMINRDYFAHAIPPCDQYVFSMMSAFGVNPNNGAGENVGWESGYGSGSANAVNSQFMGSPEHQANILNPNYTDLGVGSATTASGPSWTYPGGRAPTRTSGCSPRSLPECPRTPPLPPPPRRPQPRRPQPRRPGPTGHGPAGDRSARRHTDAHAHTHTHPDAGADPHCHGDTDGHREPPTARLRVPRAGAHLRYHRVGPGSLPLRLELRTMPPDTGRPAR